MKKVAAAVAVLSLALAAGASQAQTETEAMALENVRIHTDGKIIRKIIVIPGKIVNVVAA